MTIAIYQPARGRHHMHRRNLLDRFRNWWNNATVTVFEGNEGIVEGQPVFDAEVIDDPLHPDFSLFEPKLEQALLYDELAEDMPTKPDWEPSWLKSFTGYYHAIPVAADDEQLALPAGSAT